MKKIFFKKISEIVTFPPMMRLKVRNNQKYFNNMDLTPIIVTAIIFVTLYKVIYLFTRRKERIMLIEKLDRLSMTPPEFKANLDAVSRDLGSDSGTADLFGSFGRFTSLRWGAGTFGAGLGLVVGFFINFLYLPHTDRYYMSRQEGTVYGGCVLLFIGLALLIAFIIEMKIRRQSIEVMEKNED